MPEGGTRPRDGARSFNFVHVYPGTVLHSVGPRDQTGALGYVDATESALRLAELGIELAAEPGKRPEDTQTRPIQLVGS